MGKIIIDGEGNIIEENKENQVIEYTGFDRVNFDDPMTIIDYGADLLEEMGNLMNDVSAMMPRDDVELNDFSEKIEQISSFNDDLDKLDEKKQQQLAPVNPVVKKISSGILKLFGKEEEEVQSYGEQFDKYEDNVELIAAYVQEQLNNTLNDMELNKKFIAKMLPYIERLNVLIEAGENDVAAYGIKIQTLKQEAEAELSDEKSKEAYLGEQKIQLFERTLDDLRKNRGLISEAIEECRMRQTPNGELVLSYRSYIKATIPAMKIQAASMVGVRRQANKLANHKQLIDATNETLKKNSQMLVGNIQEATNLSIEGNIKVETLQELHKNIELGKKILADGVKVGIEVRAKNKGILDGINQSLEQSGRESLGIWEQDMLELSKGLETHDYPTVAELEKPKQKRFSFLPNTGKKGN